MHKGRNITPSKSHESNRPDLSEALISWLIMSTGLLAAMIMRSRHEPQGSRS
jgi:hypothetical protein